MRRQAIAIVLLLVVPACGITERKHRADAIVAAADRAERARTANVVFGAGGLRPVQVRGLTDVSLVVLPPYAGTADLPRRRVALTPVPGRPPAGADAMRGYGPAAQMRLITVATPRLAYLGNAMFAVRRSAGAGGVPWVSLDFDRVRRIGDDLVAVGMPTFGPVEMIDLLRGALAGSVRRVGSERVGAAATTHYRVNLDREKAFRELPDARRRALDRAFRAMGARKVVHPADVWLDGKGLPRRMLVRVTQRADRSATFEVAIGMELSGWGSRATTVVPSREETAGVDGVGAFVADLGPAIAPGAAPRPATPSGNSGSR